MGIDYGFGGGRGGDCDLAQLRELQIGGVLLELRAVAEVVIVVELKDELKGSDVLRGKERDSLQEKLDPQLFDDVLVLEGCAVQLFDVEIPPFGQFDEVSEGGRKRVDNRGHEREKRFRRKVGLNDANNLIFLKGRQGERIVDASH